MIHEYNIWSSLTSQKYHLSGEILIEVRGQRWTHRLTTVLNKLTLNHIQGCYIWAPSRSDYPQIRQILDFFKSDFSTVWLVEPKCTEIWARKSSRFIPLRANLTHFWPKSGNLAHIAQPKYSNVNCHFNLHSFLCIFFRKKGAHLHKFVVESWFQAQED